MAAHRVFTLYASTRAGAPDIPIAAGSTAHSVGCAGRAAAITAPRIVYGSPRYRMGRRVARGDREVPPGA